MRRRTLGWLIGTGVLIGITGAVLVAWFAGQDRWWSMMAALPLSDEEAAAVASCDDPGWTGLLRVLTQDLPDDCRPGWFAEQVAANVKKRHPRRGRWIRVRAWDPEQSPLQRYRAGSALLQRDLPPPPDLAIQVRLQETPVRPGPLLDVLHDQGWSEAWTGPDLRAWQVLEDPVADTPEQARAIADALRWVSLDPSQGDRTRAAERVLDALGLSGTLEDSLTRRQSGRSLYPLPGAWSGRALGRGQACASPGSTDCLRWLAEQLDARPGDLPLLRPSPEPLAIHPVWRLLDEADPRLPLVRETLLRGWAAWVASADEEDRPTRLRALVSAGAGRAVGAPQVGPTGVLSAHGGRPFSRALTATLVGGLSGVPVASGRIEAGHWLRIGDEVRWMDPCGRPMSAPEPEVPLGEAWSEEALLAQVARELAEARATAGDAVTAGRLHVLAHHLDPAAIPAPDAPDAMPLSEAVVGAIHTQAPRPVGAVAAREAWGERLQAQPQGPDCLTGS